MSETLAALLDAVHRLRLADADAQHPLADQREYERRDSAVLAVREALDALPYAARGVRVGDEGLRAALRDANLIVKMMREHLAKDHPECLYDALGILNDANRAALAATPTPPRSQSKYGGGEAWESDPDIGIESFAAPPPPEGEVDNEQS